MKRAGTAANVFGSRQSEDIDMLGSDKAIIGALAILILGIVVSVLVIG